MFSAPLIVWSILLLPLLSSGLILFFRNSKNSVTAISLCTTFCSTIGAWFLFLSHQKGTILGFEWIHFDQILSLSFNAYLDPVSCLMLVVVTTISSLVFIYSVGYMDHEIGYWRYFSALSFFLFSMLGIVLSDNLFMIFVFWELVGFSSYMLIGHYYSKNSAAEAAKEAFLVNKIGDVGFLLGILFFWLKTGSVDFSIINQSAVLFAHNSSLFTIAILLLFCGTIGKSAQFPLHIWLPNSMEGPTPVSSLLHAATMVAAGVYLLIRIFPLISSNHIASDVIQWIGVITALGGAILAMQQDDIKSILAYSTLSQLGYMVVSAGLMISATLPLFHLFTHAFFKCLLFLSAGSVILAMHHKQNIWDMGGLWKKMPFTFIFYTIGMLSLSGCVFFSGHYSKDLIMLYQWNHNRVIFWMLVLGAGLTPFYMMRQAIIVFLGSPRTEEAMHAKESSWIMLLPLFLLSIPSLLAGSNLLKNFFFHEIRIVSEPNIPYFVPMIFDLVFFLGIISSFLLYHSCTKELYESRVIKQLFYIPQFYAWIVSYLQFGLAKIFYLFDRWIIDRFIIQGLSSLFWLLGFLLRCLQTGSIQIYSLFFGFGIILLLYLLFNF